MAGDLIIGVALGALVAILAVVQGAGVGGGAVAYACGGALWFTKALLTQPRK